MNRITIGWLARHTPQGPGGRQAALIDIAQDLLLARLTKRGVFDMEKLNKVRGILGTESIRETISAAFREVIRMAAVRDLVALGESGAFDFLLEPGAEERMWG